MTTIKTGTATQRQRKRLDSWAARIASQIAGVRMNFDEPVGDYWRRMYRTGHSKLALCGESLESRRRQRLHAFAGHMARDTDGLAGLALRTRSLSWWRHFQKANLHLHPQRFNAWRWESQLETVYGPSASLFIDEPGGWICLAQDRAKWRQLEKRFVSM